jgi:hypothetical protein
MDERMLIARRLEQKDMPSGIPLGSCCRTISVRSAQGLPGLRDRRICGAHPRQLYRRDGRTRDEPTETETAGIPGRVPIYVLRRIEHAGFYQPPYNPTPYQHQQTVHLGQRSWWRRRFRNAEQFVTLWILRRLLYKKHPADAGTLVIYDPRAHADSERPRRGIRAEKRRPALSAAVTARSELKAGRKNPFFQHHG